MKNPVTRLLTPKARTQMVLTLLILNVVLIVIMAVPEKRLAPYSIIGFELAGSYANAHTMLQSWRADNVMPVIFFLLGFDYLFMLVYSFSLWFVCLHVADTIKPIKNLLIIVAWLQPLAGLLDAVENAALFRVALGSVDELWPAMAFWCAVPKFIIALSGVVLWMICGLVQLYRRFT